MSLAFYGAPWEKEESTNNKNNNSKNIIDQKRHHNRTIKKRMSDEDSRNPDIDSMIQAIHENNSNDNLANFNKMEDMEPISPPAEHRERKDENNNENLDNNIDVEAYNNLQNTYAEDYYKQYVPPYFNQMSQDTSLNTKSRDELLDKLNYMIHLLEEQQDIKSGHVTEELILYSFLGVFIIFVLDSFARAGKYVR
tara:strand:- start:1403 stop:1987 length:585 start_codon:yes stop_codon:yes gene_type:complete